jgi:hypothetical protein
VDEAIGICSVWVAVEELNDGAVPTLPIPKF